MRAQTRQSPVGAGEHVVQFYDRGDDLISAVGGYLTRAVSAGAVAIAIVTDDHRRAFQAELTDRGVDAARAVRDGSLVWLDAAATLAVCMHDGEIDAAAFRANLAPVVKRAQDGGRPVKAYGEMVALLWDIGDVVGAIELEKLWNELAGDLNFALFCGYHAQPLAGEEYADALQQVCHFHTAVLDVVSARFRAGPGAPFAARRFVASLLGCRPFGGRAPTDAARLVVSELATNAVVHADSPFSVSVRYGGSVIRISVRDWSPTMPVVRDGGPGAPSGRGLRLVDMVARDWGVETAPDGKTIWADLPMG